MIVRDLLIIILIVVSYIMYIKYYFGIEFKPISRVYLDNTTFFGVGISLNEGAIIIDFPLFAIILEWGYKHNKDVSDSGLKLALDVVKDKVDKIVDDTIQFIKEKHLVESIDGGLLSMEILDNNIVVVTTSYSLPTSVATNYDFSIRNDNNNNIGGGTPIE